MKTKIDGPSKSNKPATSLGESILARIRERHRLTNGITQIPQNPLNSHVTTDQTREDIYRQIEAEEKKSQARVYAGLSYLK